MKEEVMDSLRYCCGNSECQYTSTCEAITCEAMYLSVISHNFLDIPQSHP